MTATKPIKGLTPTYPGAAVRLQWLSWDMPITDLGDVRIMDYGAGSEKRYRVAAFLPGDIEWTLLEAPKVAPTWSVWCGTETEANLLFDDFLRRAKEQGWRGWKPR